MTPKSYFAACRSRSNANYVPDRMHSYRHTDLSEISNRIVGKILLRTIRYHTVFASVGFIVVLSTKEVGVDGG